MLINSRMVNIIMSHLVIGSFRIPIKLNPLCSLDILPFFTLMQLQERAQSYALACISVTSSEFTKTPNPNGKLQKEDVRCTGTEGALSECIQDDSPIVDGATTTAGVSCDG